ncbi:MAG: hypothetical protein H6608_01840 [Flavobacteriales bacterium]|nr:hypothetical protein [Bacteroidota bacterium]MCB9239848.1 hypothetical protein [Flavobacteriales bacterium]
MSAFRIVIITGNSSRHLSLVEQLAKQFKVELVVSEKKFSYQQAFKTTEGDSIIENHFNERDTYENNYFKPSTEGVKIVQVDKGWMNGNPDLIQQILDLRVDAIVLFGSSIIGEPILSAYPRKVINLHLGLSPYYRGSGTNFWPIVELKPECVGATIHIATPIVDAGEILHQVRPTDLDETDTIHDIGNKTIREALSQLPEVVLRYLHNQLSPIPQSTLSKKEFRRMNLTEQDMKLAYRNMTNGLLREYLHNKQNRDSSYPIVEQLN